MEMETSKKEVVKRELSGVNLPKKNWHEESKRRLKQKIS